MNYSLPNSRNVSVALAMAMAILVYVLPVSAGGRALLDSAISDAVEDELGRDNRIALHEIDVEVDSGIAKLTGTVGNILVKERAARIARTVKGVRAVVNEIIVEPSAVRHDRDLRSDIRDALDSNEAAKSYGIEVSVEDGVVRLSGTVESWQEKHLAASVAKGVRGVKAVRNLIVVNYPVDRTDEEIASDIRAGLRWDSFVDHARINVEVKNGAVQLTGTVGSAAEKQEALKDCWVAGVDSVDGSGLQVEEWARDPKLKEGKYIVQSENEIREAVRDALDYDPRVSSDAVTVEVSDRTVTLRGTLPCLGSKRAASRDARTTVGVYRVVNRIQVKTGKKISDQRIKEMIRRAFTRHPYVEDYEITVNVAAGRVKLYGAVDSYFEKAKAGEIASNISGVAAVFNNLEVLLDAHPFIYDPHIGDPYVYARDWYRFHPGYSQKSDAEIKEDITDELWWSPFIDSDEVHVTVDSGHATLTGTVDSWSEYHAATENAYEGGALLVNNRMEVAPE